MVTQDVPTNNCSRKSNTIGLEPTRNVSTYPTPDPASELTLSTSEATTQTDLLGQQAGHYQVLIVAQHPSRQIRQRKYKKKMRREKAAEKAQEAVDANEGVFAAAQTSDVVEQNDEELNELSYMVEEMEVDKRRTKSI